MLMAVLLLNMLHLYCFTIYIYSKRIVFICLLEKFNC